MVRSVAALLHHTCHPTHGYPQRWISADWPGAWSAGARGLLGQDCVPLVINGACGNIHHSNPLDPTHEDTIEAMGSKLTETTARILAELRAIEVEPLRWKSRTLQVPLRELTEQEIASARRIVDENPEPVWLDEQKTSIAWDWVYAVVRLDMAKQRETQPWYDYEIQLLRLGELAIGTYQHADWGVWCLKNRICFSEGIHNFKSGVNLVVLPCNLALRSNHKCRVVYGLISSNVQRVCEQIDTMLRGFSTQAGDTDVSDLFGQCYLSLFESDQALTEPFRSFVDFSNPVLLQFLCYVSIQYALGCRDDLSSGLCGFINIFEKLTQIFFCFPQFWHKRDACYLELSHPHFLSMSNVMRHPSRA